MGQSYSRNDFIVPLESESIQVMRINRSSDRICDLYDLDNDEQVAYSSSRSLTAASLVQSAIMAPSLKLENLACDPKAFCELPCGRLVIGAFSDRSVKIYDIKTDECLCTTLLRDRIICLLNLRNGTIAIGFRDHTIGIWRYQTQSMDCYWTGHKDTVSCLILLPEEAEGLVASSSNDNTIKIWSIGSSKCMRTLYGHHGLVRAITALTNHRLASCSWDESIKLWNITTGACIMTFLGHTGWVHCIAALPDGRIVSGGQDRTLRVWETSHGACQAIITAHDRDVYCLQMLSNGLLVSGSEDCSVKVWDMNTYREKCTFAGHTGIIRCVVELADGSVASGSSDYSIRVWSLDT
jgi:WD40 repeat protein